MLVSISDKAHYGKISASHQSHIISCLNPFLRSDRKGTWWVKNHCCRADITACVTSATTLVLYYYLYFWHLAVIHIFQVEPTITSLSMVHTVRHDGVWLNDRGAFYSLDPLYWRVCMHCMCLADNITFHPCFHSQYYNQRGEVLFWGYASWMFADSFLGSIFQLYSFPGTNRMGRGIMAEVSYYLLLHSNTSS